MNSPKSCDTFAVLPPGTDGDYIIFGKNSDRPSDEVQEVVYIPASDYSVPCKLKCTYIEIDQVPHTYGVILSKPSWMWGAEMGANEHNVCIGNEAVWTKLNDDNDKIEKLLGMDLLRLGLERAKTALEALHVIVSLIDKYGMGGNCSDTINLVYHNSFLIADPEEVWILECAGTVWAAEKITNGVRNISNTLSIGTKIDLSCENLGEIAEAKKFWDQAKGPLNFKLAFGVEEDEFVSHRYRCGKDLLLEFSKNGKFQETDMFNVLRDKPSFICRFSGSSWTTASQVSVLRKPESSIPSCHWFTATPDPSRSVFKPFIFSGAIEFPSEVISPICEQGNPHLRKFDRSHILYRMQQQFCDNSPIDSDLLMSKIKDMESKYIQNVKDTGNSGLRNTEIGKLFKMAVEEEMSLYTTHGISKPKIE